MSLDLNLLQLLKTRERYDRLARVVPAKAIDQRTAIVLKDFGAWFQENPDAPAIKHEAFMFWFKGFRHPTLKDEDVAVFDQYIKAAMAPVDPTVELGIMERLVSADTAARVTDILTSWNNGGEDDLYMQLRAAVEHFEKQVDRKVKSPQVLDDIEDLLKEEENDTGFHWRLSCLNRHIKPIRGGDFIVVAARPDKGKTTFFTDQLTHMAAQVDTLYPGENRSILWFNNEGPGRKIVTRAYQSALNATVEDLVALSNTPADAAWNAQHGKEYRSKLRQAYADAVGGRPGVLRIMDIHDMWNYEVEDLMKTHRPALVLFDMIDNIKFGGEVGNNGQRTDQLLEAMYQWARMMGVKHDCGVLATSQISADGDGLQWPTLGMLKDSKTGKQGAADVIITIGTVNDQTLESSRYMGCTKNKKGRSRMTNSPQAECIFDKDRGRYVEAPT